MSETTQEAAQEWQTFDDDQAFLKHILSKKRAEQLIAVPEWDVEILCRALNAETRIEVQMLAYDTETKQTDFRKVFHIIVAEGSFNPKTGHKIFTDAARDTLMREQDGAPVERLALAIMRISGLLQSDAQRTKKN